ncbi:unnamed protein product, partial [Iphiclides podalirius]
MVVKLLQNNSNAIVNQIFSTLDLLFQTAIKLSCFVDHDDLFPSLTILAFHIQQSIITEEIQFLNELPLEKLLRLKNSLRDLAVPEYTNETAADHNFMQNFGAQAMAMRAPAIKRGDYEEELYKKGSVSKISNIFSMSVTTLAFLAFGGYLLCLIVQAVKSKQAYNPATMAPSTFLVNAGIKKPQSQFASYGRKRRDIELSDIDLPPDELFSALIQLCEGYAQWSKLNGDG